MKNIILLLILTIGMLGGKSTNAQDTNANQKPDEKIIVNKEYDEFGNLIRYDSTYTYSHSTFGNNLSKSEMDSVMHSFSNHLFHSNFRQDFPFDFSFPTTSFFGNTDSIFQEMMSRQNSLMQHFFNDTLIK